MSTGAGISRKLTGEEQQKFNCDAARTLSYWINVESTRLLLSPLLQCD
jgi:hypothetical protein